MEAITREEKIMSGENLTPITRKEMFLAKASGQNIQTPTPITREEYFLSKITGGGGSVEGTAIPVGVAPERVYFNLNNTIKQTETYLSQLTYVQTDLFEHPICGICGYLLPDMTTPVLMFAVKAGVSVTTGEPSYHIYRSHGMTFGKIFDGGETGDGFYENNGFRVIDDDPFGDYSYSMVFLPRGLGEVVSLTDFMGLPLGLENEKIKNVLSITPFGASGGTSSNNPTAYTVSSVDELPSDAVDGSIAIVPSDSIKGIWLPIRNSLTPINKPFEEGWETVNVPFVYASNYAYGDTFFEITQYSNQLTFIGDNTLIEEITVSNCDSGDYDNVVMERTIFYENWDLFTIEFFADTDDMAFKEWLNENFDRYSGGYSLYTRENGEWVYKCEVV